MAVDLIPLPPQPPDVPWPTLAWPAAPLPAHVDPDTAETAAERLFARSEEPKYGDSYALLAVSGGRVVLERYGRGRTGSSALLSWSMAKSVLHAVIGTLVREDRLELDAPPPIAAWGEDDPRSTITLRQLLTFRDGLDWAEDYVDDSASDVITMLFGEGQDDVAAYAADRPVAHGPGDVFNYSSGTSNILSACVRDLVGVGHVEEFVRREVLDPVGIGNAAMRFDQAGTWIASSFLWCTARDFARFGYLYLRGGAWNGRRILDESWVDLARTQTAVEPGDEGGRIHGCHWWLWPDNPWGAFYASGYENQRIIVVPALDLIIVKLGRTPTESGPAVDALLTDLIRAFDPDRRS